MLNSFLAFKAKPFFSTIYESWPLRCIKTIFVIFIISNTSSFAQSKQALIIELFVVMKQDSLMDQMSRIMTQGMIIQRQMIKKEHPDMVSKSTKKLDEIMDINEFVEKRLILMRKFVKEDLIGIYDNHFTESEIKDYIQFYKTNSGQKFINEMPKLQNDVMMVMMQKYMPELKKDIDIKMEKLIQEKQK